MSQISRCFSYGLSKLWLLGVVVMVITALLVSAFRASLPYLNQYNEQVSQYLLQRYQIDLKISHIEGHWRDGGPELIIEDLRFNNLENLGVELAAGKVRAHLDFRRSVLSLFPRFSLIEISDSQLLVGRFQPSDEPASDPVPELFNLAQDIVINNSSVNFEQSSYGIIPPLKIANLHWLNSSVRHQLRLTTAAANDTAPAPLSVLADFYGTSKDDISGRLYAKATNWQWLEDLKILLPPLNSTANASANFELWSDISASSLDSMILTLGDNLIQWSVGDDKQRLSVAGGNIQWLPHQTGWLVEANRLGIESNDQAWPDFRLFVNRQQGLLSGGVDQLSIARLLTLRGLLPALSADSDQLLAQLNPDGWLRDLTFWQANQQWHYRGKIEAYSQQHVGALPQIEELDAEISGTDNDGSAKVSIVAQALDFGPYFIEPIEVDRLSSTIQWQVDGERWWIFGEDLTIETNDLDSQLTWQLAFDGKESPVLSLYGDAQVFNAKNTRRYLPHVILSDGLVDYLGDGVKGGVSSDVQILWQGALANYPYQDSSGIFEIGATLHKAKFMFDSNWLPLADSVLNLQFKNEAMVITSRQGRVKNLGFTRVSAVIPNLMQQPTLDVDVLVTDKIGPIKELMDDSPLKDSVSTALEQLVVSGPVTADINIHIPLDGSKPTVKGQVTLDNNSVDIKAIDVALAQVNGELNFVNGEVTAQKLTAEMFNQQVRLDVATKPLGDDYGVEIDLAGKWHSDKMPELWHSYLDDYMAGSLDWLGKITLKITDQDVGYQANIKSPMTGVELKLPKPLDKYVNQQEALTVSAAGNVSGGQFNLALGSRAEVQAKFEIEDDEGLNVSDMALLVGRRFNVTDTMVPNEMSLQVDLASLKIDEWQSFINNLEQRQDTNGFFPPLRSINIMVERLSLFGQTLTDVSLNGFKNQDYWQIGVLSEQAKGIVKRYHDIEKQGIVADFEYFRLSSSGAGAGPQLTKAELQAIPKLAFKCQQCQVGGYDLGKVSFDSTSDELGLAVNNLSLEALSTSLVLSGLWGADEQGEFAKVSGILESKDVVDTLKLLSFSSSIKDSDAKVEFDLGWRGSIYAPVVETMAGSVDWHLGEGHIAEVSDQGARIFSIFSLDSLRRRLVLDFRDVFIKGIFFNSFDGRFELERGVAVTHDTKMDGTAGDLEVVGSINLANTNLDYYLTFAPRLISNVPLVAGVVTSTPQVFVLAFALTKVLEPIIEVVSQVNFKLTGTVDKPEFVEVDRKRKKYKVPNHMLPKATGEPTASLGGHP